MLRSSLQRKRAPDLLSSTQRSLNSLSGVTQTQIKTKCWGRSALILGDIPLPVSDRVFMLRVDPIPLKKLLIKRYRSKTFGALADWAQRVLPSLRENLTFEIPVPIKLPRKDRTVRIGVEVLQVGSNRPILGCRYQPPRSKIVPLVRKALEAKLPKLSGAEADRRILMLELVTLDVDSMVYETVCKLAKEFPLFLRVDEFVFVRNVFGLGVVFHTWNTDSNGWSVLVARAGVATATAFLTLDLSLLAPLDH